MEDIFFSITTGTEYALLVV